MSKRRKEASSPGDDATSKERPPSGKPDWSSRTLDVEADGRPSRPAVPFRKGKAARRAPARPAPPKRPATGGTRAMKARPETKASSLPFGDRADRAARMAARAAELDRNLDVESTVQMEGPRAPDRTPFAIPPAAATEATGATSERTEVPGAPWSPGAAHRKVPVPSGLLSTLSVEAPSAPSADAEPVDTSPPEEAAAARSEPAPSPAGPPPPAGAEPPADAAPVPTARSGPHPEEEEVSAAWVEGAAYVPDAPKRPRPARPFDVNAHLYKAFARS